MSMSCAVSVVIPAFNSATTLPRAVRSALDQDLRDIEVLIVNDGSTDATEQVARQLATDARIRVISLTGNCGKPHAMNTAISEAHGRWIAVLDADDWYAAHRLSALADAGERSGAQLVADNQYFYDEAADRVVRTAFPVTLGERGLDKASFVAGCDPYSDFDMGMLKPMVRTAFIRDAKLVYRENARLSEDFLYLLEFFAAGGRGHLTSQPMYYWRQAFGSISRRWTGTAGGEWRYDFLSGARANAEVLESMRRRGEDSLARLLSRRMRAFHRLHRMQEVSRLRANGASTAQLATSILRHPSIWPLVMQRGVRRFTRRGEFTSPIRA
jgi:glycosyltransferase involved in cell wall biosynthesis